MILVIDNYDSFTYNLVQLLLSLGREVEVRRNDALTVDELLALDPDAIVLSPGPGRPEDAGICVELLRSGTPVPVLGVCLGHQALGLACGGEIELAPVLMHGKTSRVSHHGGAIFDGVPNPFEATRYHSLRVADRGLPSCLEVLARSEDETIMAMSHRELPYWGVQFHPESILTSAGGRIVERFLELAAQRKASRNVGVELGSARGEQAFSGEAASGGFASDRRRAEGATRSCSPTPDRRTVR